MVVGPCASARARTRTSKNLPPSYPELAAPLPVGSYRRVMDTDIPPTAWRPRRAIVLGAAVLVLTLTACGSSGAVATGTAATGTAATGTATSSTAATGNPSGQVAPAPASAPASAPLTESNPPGDIPDNQAYVPFTPAGGSVSVKIPEGWARVANGSTTSFSAKLNRVEVLVTDSPSTPTPASVQSKDVPALAQQVSKFTMGTISAVSRAGQPAILLTYQGDSAPDEVTGKVVRDAFERYIFTRGRTRVDLTLSGPTNADNVDPWRIVSDSLKWLR